MGYGNHLMSLVPRYPASTCDHGTMLTFVDFFFPFYPCLISIFLCFIFGKTPLQCFIFKWLLVLYSQDGDHGDDDDEDGPREADLEGRVEKYIGVKVKVCIFWTVAFSYISIKQVT